MNDPTIIGIIGIGLIAIVAIITIGAIMVSRKCSDNEDEHAQQAWERPGKYPWTGGKDHFVDEEEFK